MQICSKVLNSKISNPGEDNFDINTFVDEELNKKNPPIEKPAMSNTPMKLTFFIVGSILEDLE